MTMLTSRPKYVEPIDDRSYTRLLRKEASPDSNRMAQVKSIYYTIIFAFLLWWIPVAGPAIAGYLGGRKAGGMWKGIMASLVASSIIMFTTFALMPFKSGPLAYASYYFGSGILAISQSQLASASNVLTNMYTAFGLIRTFTLIMPSSLITLVTFGFVGGTYSEMLNHEEVLHQTYRRSLDRVTYSETRNTPRLKVTQNTRALRPRTMGVRTYDGGNEDFEDDGASMDEM
ncbi:MAG: hypothetical protein M1267_01785 [Candidatus Thermoplasmatota archaeon]|nr:hypothetical protein [Candidatus Thermoplasmatota archaeon]MCL5800274.1 hypothetical protein [Candidatus Thermoplasmatota archaeon]